MEEFYLPPGSLGGAKEYMKKKFTEEFKKDLKLEIRLMVNSFFNDVDNENKIETNLANGICIVHTEKIYQFILDSFDHV